MKFSIQSWFLTHLLCFGHEIRYLKKRCKVCSVVFSDLIDGMCLFDGCLIVAVFLAVMVILFYLPIDLYDAHWDTKI